MPCLYPFTTILPLHRQPAKTITLFVQLYLMKFLFFPIRHALADKRKCALVIVNNIDHFTSNCLYCRIVWRRRHGKKRVLCRQDIKISIKSANNFINHSQTLSHNWSGLSRAKPHLNWRRRRSRQAIFKIFWSWFCIDCPSYFFFFFFSLAY